MARMDIINSSRLGMMSPSRPYTLEAISLTPDENFLIGGGGNWRDHPGRILLWDLQTGKLTREDRWSHYELRGIVVTPDSQTVIVIGRDDHTYLDGDHYIYAGNIKSGEYTLLATWRVGSLKLGFTLDKKYLQFDKYFWDWKAGGNILNQSFQELNSRHLPASVDVAEREQEELNKGRFNKIKLSEEKTLFATAKSFMIEDTTRGKTLLTFSPGHEYIAFQFMPMAVTPDSRYLIAPRGKLSQRSYVTLGKWDIQTGQLLREFEVPSQGHTVKDIAISSDSQKAAILVYDVIRVINLNTGALAMEIIPPEME